MNTEEEERIEAVNRYIRGDKPSNICRDAGRSEKWLFNWVNRFKTGEEEWYKSRSMCVRLSNYGTQNQKKRHTKSILWTQINAD
ncbi:hypothetical protein C5S31_00370 [ANME-1 cluster archaeon GoMg2]|nr:hypothetical protein [ANME-1 cluster archaeon GoMg2]